MLSSPRPWQAAHLLENRYRPLSNFGSGFASAYVLVEAVDPYPETHSESMAAVIFGLSSAEPQIH